MNDYFAFGSYSYDREKQLCSFSYRSVKNGVEHDFTEQLTLPKLSNRDDVPAQLLDQVLSYLHLAIGTSYYKVFTQHEVRLPAELHPKEAEFFNELYTKGLGEFYFRNSLAITASSRFPASQSVERNSRRLGRKNDKVLVGVGGGKDSIVAIELLKESGYQPSLFVVETGERSPIVTAVTDTAQLPVLTVTRSIDSKLLSGIPGAHNGHIPVSSIYALIGYLLAVLYDFSYVVVGNEFSSNFGNTEYQGVEINHQWSKSLEFEQQFQQLMREMVTPDITYFSLLRPLYEIRIVELFTQYSQYFTVFTSCNRAFRIQQKSAGRWCGTCPKCVFAWLLLSAFLSPEELVSIMGQNLYEKEELTPLFRDVLGLGNMKPFDCVGTFEEARVAFTKAKNAYADTAVYRKLSTEVTVTEDEVRSVFSVNNVSTVPHQFRLCGMRTALIVGYGAEGKANENYLTSHAPKLTIGIADEKSHPAEFANQESYDLALRSPGVPKEKVKNYYTTGTNIFFSRSGNTVVGVTGTKGKSTVATLIGHILQTADIPARVLGNIGTPLIQELDSITDTDSIIVVELSSFQLDDLAYSPQIAVVTSLYADHLDYHGTKERYFGAKHNIIRNQTGNDLFIYNARFEELSAWAKDARGRAKEYDTDLAIDKGSVMLKGDHNRDNMNAAITVCRELGVSDEDILRGLRTYKPLPHRMENVGTFNGITFYDDAIGVVPEATIAAIESLDQIDTLLLGGTDRGYDFSELEARVLEKGIRNLVLFPDTGKRMFLNDRSRFTVLETDRMEEAVRFCYQHTKPGSIALLSTASPSYRLWKSYEEKGAEFQRFIKELSNTI